MSIALTDCLNCFIKKIGVLLIWKIYFAGAMKASIDDLIEQGIEALIQAKKTKDPDTLQKLVCKLETIATILRNE
jgi:hypothetical protein